MEKSTKLLSQLGLLDQKLPKKATLVQPELLHFKDDGKFPNSKFPVLIYRTISPQGADIASDFEALFKANGWPPQWRNGVYDYHHFHTVSHEVLGIASGHAKLMLGGPSGREITVNAGDAIVFPAGTAHRRLSASKDFLVVGAYPPDQQDWDNCRGDPKEHDVVVERISNLKAPSTDPIGGNEGPLTDLWKAN